MHFKLFETNYLQNFLQPWWINFTCILCHLRRKLQKKSPTLVNKFYLHLKPFETNNLQNFLQRWTMVDKFYVHFKPLETNKLLMKVPFLAEMFKNGSYFVLFDQKNASCPILLEYALYEMLLAYCQILRPHF